MVLFTIGICLSMFALLLILSACGFLLRDGAWGKTLGLLTAWGATVLLIPLAALLYVIIDTPEYNSSWLFFSVFSLLYSPVIFPIYTLIKARNQKKTNSFIAGIIGITGILCSASGVISLLISRATTM